LPDYDLQWLIEIEMDLFFSRSNVDITMAAGSSQIVGRKELLMLLRHKIFCVTFILATLFTGNCLGAGSNAKLHTTIGKYDSVGLTSKSYLVFIDTTNGLEDFYIDGFTNARRFSSKLSNRGRPIKVVWYYGKSYDTPASNDSKIIKSIRFMK